MFATHHNPSQVITGPVSIAPAKPELKIGGATLLIITVSEWILGAFGIGKSRLSLPMLAGWQAPWNPYLVMIRSHCDIKRYMAISPLIDHIPNKLRLKARFPVEAYHQPEPNFSKLYALKCLLCMVSRYGYFPVSYRWQHALGETRLRQL